MKTRIISGVAASALLAAIMFLGRRALGIAVFAAALLCIYEFYQAVEKNGHRPVKILGYISCLPLLLIGIEKIPAAGFIPAQILQIYALAIFILIIALLCIIIFQYGKVNLEDISVTLFGIFYIVFLWSFVTLVRNLDDGYIYIWMVFIGAWATDIAAYFTGVLIGRRKILPEVSPKKTLEGSIGGVVGCILAMVLFGLYANTVVNPIPLLHFAIIGLVCGCISQVGDWAASAIKRFVGIKDYGHIMPGHGGLLDRCDSILVVAPVIYFYLTFIL